LNEINGLQVDDMGWPTTLFHGCVEICSEQTERREANPTIPSRLETAGIED